MSVIQENKHVLENLFSLDSTSGMHIFLMHQAESGTGIEDFPRKKLQILGSDREYCMTSNEANLMDQLMNYVHHFYDNEIAMHESFPLLVCTKEDFNYFKVACPSKTTAPSYKEEEETHEPSDHNSRSSETSE